jgi:RNA-directed DNA polymerase
MDYPYQPLEDNIFAMENIRNCEKHVFSIQTKLDNVVANNDTKSIRETFNLLAKGSQAVRVLAVWRITQRNTGKYTAGVDGISIPKDGKDLQYQIRLKLLDEIDISRKPDPIRRVFIPKPNGKKRPLGIPTIKDRINQEILRIAIEPIAEYHFSPNSYGFRPKKCCQDAIEQIFKKLCQSTTYRYIVEGDIKGCFDNIDHNHIIKTLIDWKVPKWATETIMKMLKSGIFHKGEMWDNNTGTPQGGVISPLLANVALTTLDNFCLQQYGTDFPSRQTNPIVRYADDFVIVCKSKRKAEEIKSGIAEHLKVKVGLTLSEEKTSITHITKGFNFLGFNIRKYLDKNAKNKPKRDRDWNDYKLLIKPQKEKVIEFLQNCKEVLNNNKTAKQENIIHFLNPKLRGWAMYYRFAVSQKVFDKIDYEIWWKLYRWAIRRHPNKGKSWVVRKYFSKVGNLKDAFRDGETKAYIHRISLTPIKRFVIVNKKYRVYDNTPETQEYWKRREFTNAFNQIHSVKVARLYKRQKGICSYCNGIMAKEQAKIAKATDAESHIHHILPRSLGGSDNHSNLRLLHIDCHRELHYTISRKQMAELTKKGIDYIQCKR